MNKPYDIDGVPDILDKIVVLFLILFSVYTVIMRILE